MIFSKYFTKVKGLFTDRSLINNSRFSLYKYEKADGSFDYEKYKSTQIEGNKRKIDRVWAQESNIAFLSEYIKRKNAKPTFGICHGTRRGAEQKWFKENLGCVVLGTEISDTANNFENTIQWDFHEENPDWIGAADFVYSNSLDHAYDPQKALSVWVRTLKPEGVCIIEHTDWHEAAHSSPLDPFGVDIEVLPYMVLLWSEGTFSVREILKNPQQEDISRRTRFLVIQRN